MRKLLSTFLSFFCCLGLFSQSSKVSAEPQLHYFFTHYTTKSGLVSYQINATIQDREGYIWIGTNEGLQRFDGVRFKTFRHSENDSTSIPSNLIWQLVLDKQKNLWVLTIDGKTGIFDTRTFRFRPAIINVGEDAKTLSLSNPSPKRLITDEFGNIFLLLPGRAFVTYNKKTNRFDSLQNFPGLRDNLTIRGFAQQKGSSKYWFCSDAVGLGVYDNNSGLLSTTLNNRADEPALSELRKENEHYTDVFVDKRQRLWLIGYFGENPYVSCFDLRLNRLVLNKYQFDRKRLGYHEIRSFIEQRDSTIWIIGQNIFAKFNEKEKRFERVYNGYEEEHGIDYLTVTNLMEDREQSMWAATANNGIFRYNPSKDFFSNIQYISHITGRLGTGGPVSFMSDRDGSILVGIRDDGLYRFSKDLRQVPLNINGIPNKNNIVIWDMLVSPDSNFIWMAAAQGLYRYDVRTKSARFFTAPALQSTTIKQLTIDTNGVLWLGSSESGVFKWNPKAGKSKFEDGLSLVTKIPEVRINTLVADRDGLIWVGTNNEGAYLINPANDSIELHLHTKAPEALRLPESSAYSFLEYNDTLVMIGTNTRVLMYNRRRQKLTTVGKQLSGFVAAMERDDEGHVWIATTTSMYRLTLSTGALLQLNRDDGMYNDYFLVGSSFELPDRRMVFGVYGAMIAFLPAAINASPAVPDLKITGFTVKDVPLRIDSLLQQRVIVLSPDQNSLTIDLSVLSYNAGYALKYKLDGLDKEWRTIDQTYQLAYPYLPPGTYTLHVEAIDAEGRIGPKSIQLAIRINPPFYKTWWFYACLFLFFVLLLIMLDRQRMKRRAAIQKMRSNIAGNLHREIEIALSNINILSEMAKLKADNNPEKSKEFISEINAKSKHMILAMDDMLWSIDPENDNMHKMVYRLREFMETLSHQHRVAIEMTVDKNVEALRLDMQLRHEALSLIKENIQALVQCGAERIFVTIDHEKSHLVYRSQCNPENCNVQQIKNIMHSKDMDKRLRSINAKASLDANKSSLLVTYKFPVL